MSRQRFLFFSLFILLYCTCMAAEGQHLASPIPGFSISPYFGEQVLTFVYNPEVRITINAPSLDSFDPAKPTALVFFSLPNGNTIEQTIGKQLKAGDDWHYDIQHIGAQTRFIRSKVSEYNLVTIYLEANASSVPLSWPTWRSKYANNAALVKGLVDSMKSMFGAYHPYVVLSSHSGGGGFTFSYMNAVNSIPDEVKRIAFLDSDYNYDNTYGPRLRDWINAAPDHYLSVLAYNDSIALYNGAPVVSPTGGTWYRTRMMIAFLSGYFSFTMDSNATFITHTALNGRIKIILKQNPTQAILHTVQVELNGFIQTMLSGTPLEGRGYEYYGARAYSEFIQTARTLPKPVQIPARPSGALTGSQFMASVASMTFDQREAEIYKEVSKGNVPDFMRSLKKLQSSFLDASGTAHSVIYEVMPDYLCIGSNEDFCRIPMGPITAQRLANLFGATMPTSKLVDDIYSKAEVKLAPVTYTPVGNQNELVSKFVEHNTAIEAQRSASGKPLGSLVGGIKKDVVISNKITDPANPNHVVIYGWHQLNGVAIQPIYNGHINSYVDYSHGIRLINNELLVDSVVMSTGQILTNSTMYKVLSNETGAMTQASYLKDNTIPAAPRSFGVKSESESSLRLLIKQDTTATNYIVYLSKDGVAFPDSVNLTPGNLIVTNLRRDSLYYLKVKAVNLIGASAFLEVLAGVPSATQPQVLVVNGFDRASAGNTYDFVRQHASAFAANRAPIASATNDAVIDGLFSLGDYSIVDYILGDESTADETFSNAEQAKVKTYLQNGGKLFVSGCELAWDLDSKGTATDKDFINNFLKMRYAADAPNGVSSTTYQAEGLNGTILAGVPSIPFDNGMHGTIDVKWPDVVKPNAGGIGCGKYVNLDTSSGFSAISFQGVFPSGTKEGRLVAFGFPFETIYTESIRTQVLANILKFFSSVSAVDQGDALPKECILLQNYPNPFNPTTAISYQLIANSLVKLVVFDVLGREIATIVNDLEQPGPHTVRWDASHVPSGVYYYRLEANNVYLTKRMLVLK